MLNHCEKEREYKHNMGTMHYEHWTEYSFQGMMLGIWEVTWTQRCNTQGCELQLGTKMLLQDWGEVRSKQQMHRVQECSTTYRNTDTQRSKVSVSVSDCHPQMEQVIISSAEHRVTAHVHNSHLSKGLGSPHHRRVNNYFSCTMVFEIQLWKALPVNWHFGYYFFQKGYQPGNLYLRVKINEGSK